MLPITRLFLLCSILVSTFLSYVTVAALRHVKKEAVSGISIVFEIYCILLLQNTNKQMLLKSSRFVCLLLLLFYAI